MLTRSGVDYSGLTITEKTMTSRRVDFDYTGPWERRTEVTITGPRDLRRAASWELYERGLACAPYPYPDRDEWQGR